MKDVISACMKLTSDEIASSSREGKAYFVSDPEKGARLVTSKEHSVPDGAVSVSAETAIRRSGIFGKSFPDLLPGDEIEHITLGSAGHDDYDYRRPEIHTGTSKVSQLLREAKLSFHEADTVGHVSELFSGDRMFVRFAEDGELYSITVKDSSVTVSGRASGESVRAALCEVTFRARGDSGAFIENRMLGIMHLPIAPGKRMVFTEKGKIVPELSAHPIEKIQLKRSN